MSDPFSGVYDACHSGGDTPQTPLRPVPRLVLPDGGTGEGMKFL